MAVLGVDGCRGGWAVVTVGSPAEPVGWEWLPLAATAELLARPADAVAVDIPIGLAESGPRACDRLARSRLPGRAATVFPAPRRPAIDCGTYAEARARLAALGGPSMSAQAWGIVAAVRAVDAVITPADSARIVEAHPEVAFAAMAGDPLPPKRTAVGEAARRALLRRWPPAAVSALPVSGLPVADALDALACAWVAERWAAGRADVLSDGAHDARGLPMRIVV